MASCSFAWLSVVVKCGLSVVVPQKAVKIGRESNIGELLTTVKPRFHTETIKLQFLQTKDFSILFRSGYLRNDIHL